MSATSSPAAFVDPLADEDLPVKESQGDAGKSSARRERTSIVAPDVEGRPGAEAIDLVRSRGLIAAIETVEIADIAQQGIVVDQDPPADTHMVREGVVTLKIAQPPATHQGEGGDDESEDDSSLDTADTREDDTTAWFATLAPSPGIGGPDAHGQPRRRKQRHARRQVTEMVFDTPPDPDPSLTKLNEGPDTARRPIGLLARVFAELLVRLPSLSVSPTWRRRVLVLVGVTTAVLILSRDWGPHTHRGISGHPTRAAVSLPRVATIKVSHSPQRQRREPLNHHRSPAARSTSRRLRHKSIVVSADGAAEAGTESSIPPTKSAPATESSRPVVPDRPEPFIYLGK